MRYCRVMISVLGMLILSMCLSAEDSASTGESFYFIQITDTHWGSLNNLERTKKAVEQINSLPMQIECVIHTGDLINHNLDDQSLIQEGLETLKGLKVPVHFLPGNHDISYDEAIEAWKENIGPLITQVEYNGVIFILIYTEPLARDFTVKHYSPFDELEKILIESENRPVIVFHHSPSVDDFYNNRMHDGWNSQIRDQWVSLLNSYNVKAVIAGHFHRDEHHWLEDVPLYVSPPVSGAWGRQGAYRIYEYRNGRVGYRTQYLE